MRFTADALAATKCSSFVSRLTADATCNAGGEDGYIRLSRAHDSETYVDSNPADGVACEPFPETQTVGGECGLLFDVSYPLGAAKA